MAMLSTELVAFLIIAFVLRAFTKNEPLYQKVSCAQTRIVGNFRMQLSPFAVDAQHSVLCIP